MAEEITKIKIVLSSEDNPPIDIEKIADELTEFFEHRGMTFAMTISKKIEKATADGEEKR